MENDYHLHEVVLWNQEEGTGLTAMLSRLVKAIQLASKHNSTHEISPQYRVLSRNVGVDLSEKIVYKSFDYRDRWDDIAMGDRRSATASVNQIPGCHVFAQQEDFTLLSYPLLQGVVTAQNASQFVSIFKELASLHSKDLVHGDIRAYNMLFIGGIGRLIDYDYSGKNNVRQYPQGYWTTLPDTKRHDQARGGALLHKEHNCFSLGAVMSMYSCHDPLWSELCEKLQTGHVDVNTLLKELTAIGQASLQWTGPKLVDMFQEELSAEHKTDYQPNQNNRSLF
jgi:hypothetical protein